MQVPPLLSPIISWTHSASLACSTYILGAKTTGTAQRIGFGSHPLTELYLAREESYTQSKEAFKKFSPQDYLLLKQIKKSEDLNKLQKLQRTKESIHRLIQLKLSSLHQSEKNHLYGRLYELSRPITDDPQWGEHHLFDDLPRLINIMFSTGQLSSAQPQELILWSKEQAISTKSHRFCLEQRSELATGEIGYINGIGTSLDQARWDTYRFSDELASSHNIHAVYNTTHGYLKDLYISLLSQSGVLSEPVALLLEQWNDFFLRHPDPSKYYLQLCMSQGAIMVHLALTQLPDNLKKRISVLAIAPAYIFHQNEAREILHIIKREDTVPNALAANRHLLHPSNPTIQIVSSDPGCHPHDPHGPSYVAVAKLIVQRYTQIS